MDGSGGKVIIQNLNNPKGRWARVEERGKERRRGGMAGGGVAMTKRGPAPLSNEPKKIGT
jgi:hypothetical protein